MPKTKIDARDRSLLKLLQNNGRISMRDMAGKLGVSEGTVYNRLRKLEAGGVISGYHTMLNPQSLGYELTAIIGIKIGGEKLEEVEKELTKMQGVLSVYDVTGGFDTFVLVRFKNVRGLNPFVKSLLKVPGIISSETFVVLNVNKEDFRLPL